MTETLGPEEAAIIEAATAGIGSDPELEGDKQRNASLWSDAWIQVRRRPLFWVCITIIAVLVVAALFPGVFTSKDPRACSLRDSLLTPSSEHWFGTDLQGCDYYARTVYGARVSISVGLLVTFIATVVAIVGGSIAGYYGGISDTIIGRITDIWFAIPTVLGGIVLLTVLEDRFDRNVGTVSVVLAVFAWTTMLRLVRSSVLAVKEADFIDAARAMGASDFRIITRHILPNAIAPVIVYATITVGVIIAAEATFSFLGVGLRLPSISWGLMIAGADDRIRTFPHLLLFPGAVLSITVFAFILLGDVLRDALDPKLR
jgi:ABC-type dipeptide/oligopeptide/nickel transport system permease subunit